MKFTVDINDDTISEGNYIVSIEGSKDTPMKALVASVLPILQAAVRNDNGCPCMQCTIARGFAHGIIAATSDLRASPMTRQ